MDFYIETRSNSIPLVQFKDIAGYLDIKQKQALIQHVTEAVVAVEGEGAHPGAWGVGGQSVTTEGFKTSVIRLGNSTSMHH